MPTIQIRDVPEETYETIRRRARADGKSIQAYMREHVTEFAERRTKTEALAEVKAALSKDGSPGATASEIVADLNAERR